MRRLQIIPGTGFDIKRAFRTATILGLHLEGMSDFVMSEAVVFVRCP